jgi:3-hydroxybenzoate 6-monooxygenase
MNMPSDDEVIVAGGGIGGLGAALALARTGVSVRVLERAPQFSEVGAGLQIGPNAVRAFDRLGVLAEIYEAAVFPDYGEIRDAVSGRKLTRIDFQGPMIERFGYPYLVLHRNDVLQTLLHALHELPHVKLENDATVESVVDEGGRVRIMCEQGQGFTAQLVVGADGINSRVRARICDDEPVFSGAIAYRGTIPIDEVDGEYSDCVRLWIGPGVHLMQYPVRRGELYNQVAVFSSGRWREGLDDWGTPEELIDSFKGTCEPVRSAAMRLSLSPAYPNFDKEPLASFVKGRSVLIGDAAHPMLQYVGQGACMALEDGVVLATLLAGSVQDPGHALAAYEAARITRTTRCQRLARPWGASWHTDDPTLVAYRDRFLRARRADDYSDVEWLYDDAITVGPGKVLSEIEGI